MVVPKPPPHRQKKAKNNHTPKKRHICEVCGVHTWCHTHEEFGGIRRQISIKMKFQRQVCPVCHQLITEEKLKGITMQWRTARQRKYEAEHGHDAWMALMGKSYLQEDLC